MTEVNSKSRLKRLAIQRGVNTMKGRPYNLVLLSAERAGSTVDRNLQASLRLAGLLALWGYEYSKCEGQYEGRREVSYAVKVYPPVDDALPWLRLTAFQQFEQDSILLVDTQDQAALIFNDGSEKFIGIWSEVDSVDLIADKDYTRIGDRYFTVA